MKTKTAVEYIKNLVSKFFADGGMRDSATIAFYLMFSIFPLLMILFLTYRNITGDSEFPRTIIEFLNDRIPIISSFLEQNLLDAEYRSNTVSTGIIGAIFIILATTYVFETVQYSISKIFSIKEYKKYWFQKINGFLIVFLIMLTILIIYLITTPLFYFSDSIVDYLKIPETMSNIFLKMISLFADLLLTFSIFAILYYFGSYRKMSFKQIYMGALIGAVSWVIGKHIIIVFFKYFADFDLVYGTAGTTITFLFWIYISSMIFLVGAEINSLSSHNVGSVEKSGDT